MVRKVLIDEDFLDRLLNKSLPEEYLVLAQQYQMSSDEETYYLLLIELFLEILDSTKKWLKDLDENINLDELDVFFFDEVNELIGSVFKSKFADITTVLLTMYDEGKYHAINELNVTPVDFINESLTIATIKHQNHQVVGDLINEVSNNMKDVVWNGIKDKLNIDEIASKLVSNGLKPKGKFSVEQRARMIAVTERNRAYNTAKLQTYHNYGVKLVDIVTAGDSKVCTICIKNAESNPYTIQEVQELVPSHVYCRCTVKPHFENEQFIDELIPSDLQVDLTNY